MINKIQKLKIIKKYKAFSLVELLIVIAIIGIMTTVGFVSMNSNRTSAKLQAAQREVASIIKLTQSYALQGKAQGGSTPCGYGFRFTGTSSYEIFYNTSATTCDQANAVAAYLHFKSSAPVSQTAETGSLKNGVTRSSPVALTDTEIYWTVPFGVMYDKTGTGFLTAKTFTLSLPGGETKTIKINTGGGITEN